MCFCEKVQGKSVRSVIFSYMLYCCLVLLLGFVLFVCLFFQEETNFFEETNKHTVQSLAQLLTICNLTFFSFSRNVRIFWSTKMYKNDNVMYAIASVLYIITVPVSFISLNFHQNKIHQTCNFGL